MAVRTVTARLSRTPKPLTKEVIRGYVKVGMITPGEGNKRIEELENKLKQQQVAQERRYHYKFY